MKGRLQALVRGGGGRVRCDPPMYPRQEALTGHEERELEWK